MPSRTGWFRSSFRALLIGSLAIAVVASSGCLVRRRKIEHARGPHIGLITAGLDQLNDMIKQRYDAIETLNATVDLEPSLVSASKGEIADYKDVRGYILIRKPATIRVVALYPIVRGTAIDMVSDGQSFRLYLPSKNLFLVGQNRIETPSEKKLENLRPQHLLDALLIRPPDPKTEKTLLESWSDDDGADYLVHIIRQDGKGHLQLARKVWFDRVSLEIVRHQVFDDGGELATDARYAGWERRGGVSYPKNIQVVRPKDGYELNIRFQKLSVNEPIGDDRFQLPQPEGVKVERVGGQIGG